MDRISVRWFAFALALCGCVAHPCRYDNRPMSISSWNPPKREMIPCPWKPYENDIRGYRVEGKACDWNMIRCNIAYLSCVQTFIQISEDSHILVACLPHDRKPMKAHLTQPTIISRRRRSLQTRLRRRCRKERKKCPHHQVTKEEQ